MKIIALHAPTFALIAVFVTYVSEKCVTTAAPVRNAISNAGDVMEAVKPAAMRFAITAVRLANFAPICVPCSGAFCACHAVPVMAAIYPSHQRR